MKIIILATPKSGNNWLKNMLSSMYQLRPINLINEQTGIVDDAQLEGDNWIAHSHAYPTTYLTSKLEGAGVNIITIFRHPADILVSLVSHVRKKSKVQPDELYITEEVENFGAGVLSYVRIFFFSILAISHLWKSFGAMSVKYEDLSVNPYSTLMILQHYIGYVDENRTKLALAESDISVMRRLGSNPQSSYSLDGGSEFFRHGATGDGRTLPESIKCILHSKPFAQLIHSAGYELEPQILPKFDVSIFDPFKGHFCFDNGVTISAEMFKLFLTVPSISSRWSEPWKVEQPNSFYDWLNSTSASFQPPITNLISTIYESRADLKAAFPDLAYADRTNFLIWFISQGYREYQITPDFLGCLIDGQSGLFKP